MVPRPRETIMALKPYPIIAVFQVTEKTGEHVGVTLTLQQAAADRMKGKSPKVLQFAIPVENVEQIAETLKLAALEGPRKGELN